MSLAQHPDKFEYFLGTDASFRPRLEAVLWQARTAVAQCILAHLADGGAIANIGAFALLSSERGQAFVRCYAF